MAFRRFAIFTGAPHKELTFLQPSCATTAVGCLSPIQNHEIFSTAEPPDYCAFGGCTIDDAGHVLGYDPSTNDYAVHTIGLSSSTIELPLPTSVHVVAMNRAGKVVYVEMRSGARSIVSAVYDRLAGTSTVIPPVAATSCVHYFPLSMNNLGEVLGFTSRCASRDFYWTWDPMHGTQQVSASVPAGASKFMAYGVNDKAQILVSFEASGGAVHWGMLDAPAATRATFSSREKDVHHVR